MAKKNFVVNQTDITTALTGTPQVKQTATPEQIGQPIATLTQSETQPSGRNKGLRIDEERVSFVLLTGQYEKLQGIAYWERKTVKDTLIDILEETFDRYEKEKGAIAVKPTRRR